MKAIQIPKSGGREVIQYEDSSLGAPECGEVRLLHTAPRVEYFGTHYRSDAFMVPFSIGLGNEAAGVIEAIGAAAIYCF